MRFSILCCSAIYLDTVCEIVVRIICIDFLNLIFADFDILKCLLVISIAVINIAQFDYSLLGLRHLDFVNCQVLVIRSLNRKGNLALERILDFIRNIACKCQCLRDFKICLFL